ncbi:MAG: leucine-rich repeat domain-containing protein [Ruminococcaceae bacterium]|nr:leucine-rich repeat domain-containing protein [Oscillospiraceae bacterium]
MILTKEVTMNLNYWGSPIVMDALQGDSGRELIVHLLAGEEAWSVPADTSVMMRYVCGDGTGGTYDTLPDGSPAYALQDGAVTVSLIPQLFAVPGCTQLQITFVREDVQLSTFAMEIYVHAQVNTEAPAAEYINLATWLNAHKKGDTGDSGVYLGTQEPENPQVRVWIDPEGTESTTYYGWKYSNAVKFDDGKQFIDISGENSTVKLYLFATNDGYDAVVSGTGAIENGDLTVNSYMDIKADNRPHKDYVGKITRLHIESGITSIGDNFMLGAYRLQKLTFGNSKAITHLGAYAFAITSVDGEYDFSGLEDKTLHSVFWSCSKLKGVTLSEDVETIGAKSFYKCYSLQEVKGLSSVTTVEELAFYDCHSLAEVDLNPAQVSLGDNAFSHIATSAKITGTHTLLFNAEWDSGADCFTQKDWGENLEAVRSTKGESVTLPLPVFDSQCEPSYRDWDIIWVDLPYDPETGKDPVLQKGSVRMGGCGLFSYYHIYNSLHPDAQYPSFKEFVERFIFTKEIEVTQELHDWLNASEVGRALIAKNTAVSYDVGSKINVFDLPHALYYGDDVGNEQDGAIFWGFLQACQFEGTTVYASDFENGVSNMKKAMIEALHAGKPIKLSRHSHAVSVFGYDKETDRFLIYDSASFLPAAQYANVYWANLEAVTSPASAYGACQIITEEKLTMNDMDKKLDVILQSVRVRVITGSFTPTENIVGSFHLDIPNGAKLVEIITDEDPQVTSNYFPAIIYVHAATSMKENFSIGNYTNQGAGIKIKLKSGALNPSWNNFDNTNGLDIELSDDPSASICFMGGTKYRWTAYYWD